MHRQKIFLLTIISLLFIHLVQSQDTDSLSYRVLDTITVQGFHNRPHFMSSVVGASLFTGKKTETVMMSGADANLSQNLGRMAFSRLPGVNIWDMDGAGTQINIGTRGTDAHRSIEMNMRQNGYNTNSDIFGYPENHYTPPLQAVQEVQLLRGASSLQFGSQFGGMMNYVMKKGSATQPLSLESVQTHGSNNFFNSFNAVGGTVGRVNYYAYYDNRHGDGWRDNAAFNYNAYYAGINYALSKHTRLSLEFSRMSYRQQIAGGLTDAQFDENPRQSNRARNFFSPTINIPAFKINSDLSANTHLEITLNGIWGDRSSVQFINTPDVPDTVNTPLGAFNPRQVDRDFYQGITSEVRLLHTYAFGKIKNTLAGGIRYSHELTKRRQKGVGTTASDFDLGVTGPYGIDLKFHTTNYAAFIENAFALGQKLTVTPGARMEVIQSNLDGVINKASVPVTYSGQRSFPLLGLGAQYQLNKLTQLYANATQAYRPYLYANITPADQITIIDPNLKDSKGYHVDLGYRGQWSEFLNFDIGMFYLYYGNKIGKLTMNQGSASYLLTTNVGNSVAKGIEAYINLSLAQLFGFGQNRTDVSIFNSLGYTHARYTSGQLLNGSQNMELRGNRVEGTPDWVNRSGLEVKYHQLKSSFQVSYVSRHFSDANNTVFNPTGATGVVPAYTLLDWVVNYTILGRYTLNGGINNLSNVHYFSRRITMYPGPGILPGDGRTYYISFGVKM